MSSQGYAELKAAQNKINQKIFARPPTEEVNENTPQYHYHESHSLVCQP